MSRRLYELLFLCVLGLAVAMMPNACGGSDGNGDGGDRVDGMTQT
jgi:hypothetical protein